MIRKAILFFFTVVFLPLFAAEDYNLSRLNAALKRDWKRRNVSAVRCDDATFLRRAMLCGAGKLPASAEVRRFLADQSPDKRSKLIDSIVNSPEFCDLAAMRLAEICRIKSEFPINLWPNAVQLYHLWLRENIRRDEPWDRMVFQLLTASGSDFREAPANFFRAVPDRTPEGLAKSTALTLLCVRTEKLAPEERKSFAAFFSRIRYKKSLEWKEEIVFTGGDAGLIEARDLEGNTHRIQFPSDDPRAELARWITSERNPWFARAFANRVWAWLFGCGLVNPPDDLPLDVKQLASAEITPLPDTFAAMAQIFRDSGYSIRTLFAVTMKSDAFQCDWKSEKPEALPAMQQCFACYPVHRIEAEILADMLGSLTGKYDRYSSVIPEPFTFLPNGYAAVKIADGSISSSFLDKFGRAPRDSGQFDERKSHFTAAQRQYLLNSSTLHARLRTAVEQLVRSMKKNPDKLIKEIYLRVLSRPPSADETKRFFAYQEHLTKKERYQAWQDLFWALINTSEFICHH